MKSETRYTDLLALPHPVSRWRAAMSRQDRAAQFAPFAALTGYEDTIEETARLTDMAAYLDEARVEELDRLLRQLKEKEAPRVKLLRFLPDRKKAGGAYVQISGTVKKVDELQQLLILTDGEKIPFAQIYGMEIQSG